MKMQRNSRHVQGNQTVKNEFQMDALPTNDSASFLAAFLLLNSRCMIIAPKMIQVIATIAE